MPHPEAEKYLSSVQRFRQSELLTGKPAPQTSKTLTSLASHAHLLAGRGASAEDAPPVGRIAVNVYRFVLSLPAIASPGYALPPRSASFDNLVAILQAVSRVVQRESSPVNTPHNAPQTDEEHSDHVNNTKCTQTRLPSALRPTLLSVQRHPVPDSALQGLASWMDGPKLQQLVFARIFASKTHPLFALAERPNMACLLSQEAMLSAARAALGASSSRLDGEGNELSSHLPLGPRMKEVEMQLAVTTSVGKSDVESGDGGLSDSRMLHRALSASDLAQEAFLSELLSPGEAAFGTSPTSEFECTELLQPSIVNANKASPEASRLCSMLGLTDLPSILNSSTAPPTSSTTTLRIIWAKLDVETPETVRVRVTSKDGKSRKVRVPAHALSPGEKSKPLLTKLTQEIERVVRSELTKRWTQTASSALLELTSAPLRMQFDADGPLSSEALEVAIRRETQVNLQHCLDACKAALQAHSLHLASVVNAIKASHSPFGPGKPLQMNNPLSGRSMSLPAFARLTGILVTGGYTVTPLPIMRPTPRKRHPQPACLDEDEADPEFQREAARLGLSPPSKRTLPESELGLFLPQIQSAAGGFDQLLVSTVRALDAIVSRGQRDHAPRSPTKEHLTTSTRNLAKWIRTMARLTGNALHSAGRATPSSHNFATPQSTGSSVISPPASSAVASRRRLNFGESNHANALELNSFRLDGAHTGDSPHPDMATSRTPPLEMFRGQGSFTTTTSEPLSVDRSLAETEADTRDLQLHRFGSGMVGAANQAVAASVSDVKTSSMRTHPEYEDLDDDEQDDEEAENDEDLVEGGELADIRRTAANRHGGQEPTRLPTEPLASIAPLKGFKPTPSQNPNLGGHESIVQHSPALTAISTVSTRQSSIMSSIHARRRSLALQTVPKVALATASTMDDDVIQLWINEMAENERQQHAWLKPVPPGAMRRYLEWNRVAGALVAILNILKDHHQLQQLPSNVLEATMGELHHIWPLQHQVHRKPTYAQTGTSGECRLNDVIHEWLKKTQFSNLPSQDKVMASWNSNDSFNSPSLSEMKANDSTVDSGDFETEAEYEKRCSLLQDGTPVVECCKAELGFEWVADLVVPFQVMPTPFITTARSATVVTTTTTSSPPPTKPIHSRQASHLAQDAEARSQAETSEYVVSRSRHLYETFVQDSSAPSFAPSTQCLSWYDDTLALIDGLTGRICTTRLHLKKFPRGFPYVSMQCLPLPEETFAEKELQCPAASIPDPPQVGATSLRPWLDTAKNSDLQQISSNSLAGFDFHPQPLTRYLIRLTPPGVDLFHARLSQQPGSPAHHSIGGSEEAFSDTDKVDILQELGMDHEVRHVELFRMADCLKVLSCSDTTIQHLIRTQAEIMMTTGTHLYGESRPGSWEALFHAYRGTSSQAKLNFAILGWLARQGKAQQPLRLSPEVSGPLGLLIVTRRRALIFAVEANATLSRQAVLEPPPLLMPRAQTTSTLGALQQAEKLIANPLLARMAIGSQYPRLFVAVNGMIDVYQPLFAEGSNVALAIARAVGLGLRDASRFVAMFSYGLRHVSSARIALAPTNPDAVQVHFALLPFARTLLLHSETIKPTFYTKLVSLIGDAAAPVDERAPHRNEVALRLARCTPAEPPPFDQQTLRSTRINGGPTRYDKEIDLIGNTTDDSKVSNDPPGPDDDIVVSPPLATFDFLRLKPMEYVVNIASQPRLTFGSLSKTPHLASLFAFTLVAGLHVTAHAVLSSALSRGPEGLSCISEFRALLSNPNAAASLSAFAALSRLFECYNLGGNPDLDVGKIVEHLSLCCSIELPVVSWLEAQLFTKDGCKPLLRSLFSANISNELRRQCATLIRKITGQVKSDTSMKLWILATLLEAACEPEENTGTLQTLSPSQSSHYALTPFLLFALGQDAATSTFPSSSLLRWAFMEEPGSGARLALAQALDCLDICDVERVMKQFLSSAELNDVGILSRLMYTGLDMVSLDKDLVGADGSERELENSRRMIRTVVCYSAPLIRYLLKTEDAKAIHSAQLPLTRLVTWIRNFLSTRKLVSMQFANSMAENVTIPLTLLQKVDQTHALSRAQTSHTQSSTPGAQVSNTERMLLAQQQIPSLVFVLTAFAGLASVLQLPSMSGLLIDIATNAMLPAIIALEDASTEATSSDLFPLHLLDRAMLAISLSPKHFGDEMPSDDASNLITLYVALVCRVLAGRWARRALSDSSIALSRVCATASVALGESMAGSSLANPSASQTATASAGVLTSTPLGSKAPITVIGPMSETAASLLASILVSKSSQWGATSFSTQAFDCLAKVSQSASNDFTQLSSLLRSSGLKAAYLGSTIWRFALDRVLDLCEFAERDVDLAQTDASDLEVNWRSLRVESTRALFLSMLGQAAETLTLSQFLQALPANVDSSLVLPYIKKLSLGHSESPAL